MLVPHRVLVAPKVEDLIRKRWLYTQFLKAKNNLLHGFVLFGIQLRKRQPTTDDIWYFRINNQYRAIGKFDQDGDFLVLSLDDHQ